MSYQFRFTPFPTLVSITDLKVAGGRTNGPVVRVDPDYGNREAALAHEYRHVTHWWVCVLIGWMMLGVVSYVTTVSPEVFISLFILAGAIYPMLMRIPYIQLWCEVDCYAVQFRVTPEDEEYNITQWATVIKEYYKFDYSIAYIENQIKTRILNS